MGRLTDFFGGASSGSGGGGNADGLRVELNKEVAEAQRKALAKLMVSDPDTRKRIVAVIRKELRQARSRTAKDVHSSLGNDPRKAYRAVKHAIYKQVLGGNISILASRRAGARYMLVKQRKLDENPNQWGGNRRARSKRTEDIDTYFGKDRGFILRFLDAGTDDRMTKYGRRGSIAARPIFGIPATFQMQVAAENIGEAMLEELDAAYNKELE